MAGARIVRRKANNKKSVYRFFLTSSALLCVFALILLSSGSLVSLKAVAALGPPPMSAAGKELPCSAPILQNRAVASTAGNLQKITLSRRKRAMSSFV